MIYKNVLVLVYSWLYYGIVRLISAEMASEMPAHKAAKIYVPVSCLKGSAFYKDRVEASGRLTLVFQVLFVSRVLCSTFPSKLELA